MQQNIVSDKKIDEPLFSIITVCLNAGDSLLQTIDSVLMQNFTNFELIVKDGVSNDGSYEKLPTDVRIVKLQKKDTGIYDAMNQALSLATGQYVLFLNAGDFFYDNEILSCYNKSISENSLPGLVYCDYKTTGLGEYIQSPPKLTDFYLFRTMLCHQVCMVKREYYERIGTFDTEFKVDADYDFLLRLLIRHNSRYIHFSKLGIVSTSNGFSFQNKVLAKKEVKLIRKKYFPEKYFIYIALLSITLPSLREKLASKTGYASKIYHRIVNVFNRI